MSSSGLPHVETVGGREQGGLKSILADEKHIWLFCGEFVRVYSERGFREDTMEAVSLIRCVG